MTLANPKSSPKDFSRKVNPFYQERIDSSFKSPLEDLIKLIPQFNNPKMKRDQLVSFIKTKRDREYWESKLTPEELAELKNQYKSISTHNIVSQNKLFKFMGIKEFIDTSLGGKLFRLFSKTATTSFFSWDTFLCLMGVIHYGDIDDKIKLLYRLFDDDFDNYVSKDEMIKILNELFIILKTVRFNNGDLSGFKEIAEKLTEFEINDVVIEIVNDIFENFGKSDEFFMTKEEIIDWMNSNINQ